MQFKLLATSTPDVPVQLQWLWYSNLTRRFITGDGRKAFAMEVARPGVLSPLTPERPYDDGTPPRYPCNLPTPASLTEEISNETRHGFRLLEPAAYLPAAEGGCGGEGDLVGMLAFGPRDGHFMLHPASGLVVSVKAGSMELRERVPGGFKLLEKARTRGRAALVFAAHPSETLLVYGDNYGEFFAHRFDATGFGKASKIAAKQRNANRAEFARDGRMLMIGGPGYLATYSYAGGKFTPLHEVSIAVRDFIWHDEGKLVLVSQGLHGVPGYRYNESGFVKIGAAEPTGGAREIAASGCGRYMAVLSQESADVSVYEIAGD